MPESVVQPRGVSVVEALNTRSGTTHIPHLLPVKVIGEKDRDRDRDRDSGPSSITRTGVGRRSTPTCRTGHHSRTRHHLLTNRPETMRAEST